jgi:hypothetical protein
MEMTALNKRRVQMVNVLVNIGPELCKNYITW